jgi:hypothetical protein
VSNSFRSQIGSHRASALQGAMAALGGNEGLGEQLGSSIQSGAQDRMGAIEKAQAWQQRGVDQFSNMGDQFMNMTAQAGQQGIQALSSARQHELQKEVAEAQNSANALSGAMGIVGALIPFF